MNTISIVNLRNTRSCTRVDRATVLGNPFVMHSEAERDSVCEQYIVWLNEQYRSNAEYSLPLKHAINMLVERYNDGKDLMLGCWCAPKRCHAETIRHLILTLSQDAQEDEQHLLDIERGDA